MRRIMVGDVVRAAARVWDVPTRDILEYSLFREHCAPRTAVCWIASAKLRRSSLEIAAALGRDHTTVLHNVERAEVLAARDSQFRARLAATLALLGLDGGLPPLVLARPTLPTPSIQQGA